RHTSFSRDWSSDVCSSDLRTAETTKEPGSSGCAATSPAADARRGGAPRFREAPEGAGEAHERALGQKEDEANGAKAAPASPRSRRARAPPECMRALRKNRARRRRRAG